LIIGEKEQKAKSVAVRARNQKDLGSMKTDKFIKQILAEISNRK
jgi:threonyl-tRNA synthetase